mmetsp:Transcript_11038/g.27901  ORF Transcript_11038/g.27901 Transcript_11038/m.27901 type:complete len:296 (+) Transcript_11038:603-1490(+)
MACTCSWLCHQFVLVFACVAFAVGGGGSIFVSRFCSCVPLFSSGFTSARRDWVRHLLQLGEQCREEVAVHLLTLRPFKQGSLFCVGGLEHPAHPILVRPKLIQPHPDIFLLLGIPGRRCFGLRGGAHAPVDFDAEEMLRDPGRRLLPHDERNVHRVLPWHLGHTEPLEVLQGLEDGVLLRIGVAKCLPHPHPSQLEAGEFVSAFAFVLGLFLDGDKLPPLLSHPVHVVHQLRHAKDALSAVILGHCRDVAAQEQAIRSIRSAHGLTRTAQPNTGVREKQLSHPNSSTSSTSSRRG